MSRSKADELAEAISKPKRKNTKSKPQKEGGNMKKTILTIVLTIIVTLGVVASYAFTYQQGRSSAIQEQKNIEARIDEVVSRVTPKESKN